MCVEHYLERLLSLLGSVSFGEVIMLINLRILLDKFQSLYIVLSDNWVRILIVRIPECQWILLGKNLQSFEVHYEIWKLNSFELRIACSFIKKNDANKAKSNKNER